MRFTSQNNVNVVFTKEYSKIIPFGLAPNTTTVKTKNSQSPMTTVIFMTSI